MQKLNRCMSLIDNISDWSGKILSFAVPIIIIIMVFESIMRYFFNNPTIWSFEIVQFLFGGAFVLSGAYVLRHNAHVRIDVLYNLFPPRWRAIMDLVACGFILFFGAGVFFGGMQFAGSSWQVREISLTPFAPPLYFIKSAIPLAGILILLQGLVVFSRSLITVLTGRQEKR